MTAYTGFGASAPAVTYGADTSRYTLATAFKVTSAGMSLTKGRIYLSSNGGAVTAADVLNGTSLEFTLFGQSPSAGGAVAPQLFSSVLLGSLTMDAWNEFILPTPYALTSGTVYYASVYLPAGRYSFIGSEFTTGDIVAGPITFPQHGSAVPGLGTVINGGFIGGGTGPQAINDGSGTWYGIDVEVQDAGGATITGSASASLGALSGTATGTRTVVAAAGGALGGLAASVAGSRTVLAAATGALSRLTGAVAGTRETFGSATATLGGLTATARTTAAIPPNNDVVGVAWLRAVLDSAVATDLPQDPATWGTDRVFTTVQVAGGSPNNDVPIAAPVFEVTCWAAPTAGGSRRPPWNRANARAEAIRAAVLAHRDVPRAVTLPAGYGPARVLQAAMRTEPRRAFGDRADYAAYTFDLQVWWTP